MFRFAQLSRLSWNGTVMVKKLVFGVFAAAVFPVLTACSKHAVAAVPYQPYQPAQTVQVPQQQVTQQVPQQVPSQQVPQQQVPQQGIPSAYVGTWCGGSNAEPAHWTLTFGADGSFSASNPDRPSYGGTAVISGNTLTVSVTSGGQTHDSIGLTDDPEIGKILSIDGYTYVPGSCSSS